MELGLWHVNLGGGIQLGPFHGMTRKMNTVWGPWWPGTGNLFEFGFYDSWNPGLSALANPRADATTTSKRMSPRRGCPVVLGRARRKGCLEQRCVLKTWVERPDQRNKGLWTETTSYKIYDFNISTQPSLPIHFSLSCFQWILWQAQGLLILVPILPCFMGCRDFLFCYTVTFSRKMLKQPPN